MDAAVVDELFDSNDRSKSAFVPRRMEIISSLGEVGVIDGDSLLYEILFGKYLVDYKHGLQFVHLMESAERLLLQFVRRKSRLVVAFFEVGTWLWSAQPLVMLARRILALHLRRSHVEVVHFPDWASNEWKSYCVDLNPGWILAFDSTAISESHSDVSRYWRKFSLFHLAFGLHVALVPGLEYRSNDVYAWVEDSFISADVNGEMPWCNVRDFTNIPMLSATEAVYCALEACAGDVGIQKKILQCFHFCQTQPLSRRFIPLLEEDPECDARIVSTLELFCRALYPFACADLVDVIDGRLIYYVVKHNVDLNDPDVILPADVHVVRQETQKAFPESKVEFVPNFHFHTGKTLQFGAEKNVPKSNNDWGKRNQQRSVGKAAFIDKKLSDSLIGKFVQPIDVNVKKPAKSIKKGKKSKTGKMVALSLEKYSAKVLDDEHKKWKKWLHSQGGLDATKALSYVKSCDFSEEVEIDILFQIATDFKDKNVANSILYKLVSRSGGVDRKRLSELAKMCGFVELSSMISGKSNDPDKTWLNVQLKQLSEYLVRDEGEPDKRVRLFCPDGWQKNLLDIVDRHQSAIVVAPTSAGKTFIQYYVMEQVLSTDDIGVAVYVCPSKALCNQVLAGVRARFRKKYKYPSTHLCGLFTQDMREFEDCCQILVTVPQCLDILVLNPTIEGRAWVQKIRWIIFDEVHCLNDPDSGPVWERLLQLTVCPFLALSASIGEPKRFQQWLSSTRKEEVHLIEFHERYNDLRYSVVSSMNGECNSFHPFSVVKPKDLAEKEFPSLCELEPRDALLIFEAMAKQNPSGVIDLEPEVVFKASLFISRRQAKIWLGRLKDRLLQWSNGPELAIVEKCFEIMPQLGHCFLPNSRLEEQQALLNVTQHLLLEGPVMLFCFVRDQTESMVAYFTSQMKEKQENDEVASIDKQKKKKERKEKHVNRKEVLELQRDGLEEEVFVREELYPLKYTFRSTACKSDKEERQEIINDVIKKTKWNDDDPLIQGLYRGVGCHHAGLPHRYRMAVELLFRTGGITVVFSTMTLAQGIHAPCRSVVIVRDSTFLSSTSFRQMSGRAGRRGFDDLGQVVFFGVREGRIRQIMNSAVPQLRGAFPLSASLTLRMSMLQNCDESARNGIRQMLEQSLLSHGELADVIGGSEGVLRQYSDIFKNFLRELGVMLDDKPVWLAAVVSHLSWMDPANLVLLYFIRHKIFEDAKTPQVLLTYLACILMPIPVHKSMMGVLKGLSSRVVEEVPLEVQKGLMGYNAMVRHLFMKHLQGLSSPQDCCLPLSRVQIGSVAAEPNSSACSLFARTSGVDESKVDSLDLLVNIIRIDLCVDHSSVPIVKEMTHFNSFLVDFYKQESPNTDVLVRDNKIKNAWHLVKDFSLAIRVIGIALTKLHFSEATLDPDFFRLVGKQSLKESIKVQYNHEQGDPFLGEKEVRIDIFA
jgi:hypothetical protein